MKIGGRFTRRPWEPNSCGCGEVWIPPWGADDTLAVFISLPTMVPSHWDSQLGIYQTMTALFRVSAAVNSGPCYAYWLRH